MGIGKYLFLAYPMLLAHLELDLTSHIRYSSYDLSQNYYEQGQATKDNFNQDTLFPYKKPHLLLLQYTALNLSQSEYKISQDNAQDRILQERIAGFVSTIQISVSFTTFHDLRPMQRQYAQFHIFLGIFHVKLTLSSISD